MGPGRYLIRVPHVRIFGRGLFNSTLPRNQQFYLDILHITRIAGNNNQLMGHRRRRQQRFDDRPQALR